MPSAVGAGRLTPAAPRGTAARVIVALPGAPTAVSPANAVLMAEALLVAVAQSPRRRQWRVIAAAARLLAALGARLLLLLLQAAVRAVHPLPATVPARLCQLQTIPGTALSLLVPLSTDEGRPADSRPPVKQEVRM